MPKLTCVSRASDETWQQLELRFAFPEQRVYELIRPVVLYGQSPAERATETGTSERTLYRQVERFRQDGICGLCPPDISPPHTLPANLKALVLDLKAEHPPLRVNQIATICYARTSRRPDDKTIKRVLAENDLPRHADRRFPLYHQIADPAERRATIIRLHFEGWGKKAISEYLHRHRDTVHATLRRWATEGLGRLYNKSRAPLCRIRKVNLKVMDTVRRLQRNPLLGEFRVSAALKQQYGIKLSPRSCGRILALNRRLYADLRNEPPAHEKKPMPFQASRRHEFWSVDIRYLTKKEQTVSGVEVAYSITILDNYLRAILASVLSCTQDLSAYLLVLFAAIAHYGAPGAIVSDGGGVFKAKQAQTIY